VDRFQGQEGQVSIVSMATSSGDDLPRNIEFLMQPHSRLNVAVSRARILAVVVASPSDLFDHHPVHQLELVNSLCWMGEDRAAVRFEAK